MSSTYFQNFVVQKTKNRPINAGGRVIDPTERMVIRMLEERKDIESVDASLDPGENGVRILLENTLRPYFPNYTIINTKLFIVIHQLTRLGQDFKKTFDEKRSNIYKIFNVSDSSKNKFDEDVMIYYNMYLQKTDRNVETVSEPIQEEYSDDDDFEEEEDYYM